MQYVKEIVQLIIVLSAVTLLMLTIGHHMTNDKQSVDSHVNYALPTCDDITATNFKPCK